MTTKRHILIGAVALVKGKVREDGKVMVSICDEFEQYFISNKLLEGAPFQVVSLIIRYGNQAGEPEIGKINKKYSELEVAVGLPMEEIKKLKYDDLRERIRNVTLDAMIAVSKKYDLPAITWEQLRQK